MNKFQIVLIVLVRWAIGWGIPIILLENISTVGSRINEYLTIVILWVTCVLCWIVSRWGVSSIVGRIGQNYSFYIRQVEALLNQPRKSSNGTLPIYIVLNDPGYITTIISTVIAIIATADLLFKWVSPLIR